MITLSDASTSIITGGRPRVVHVAVESWLGGTLLAEEVPVASAAEEGDRSLRVPERLTLTVPRRYRGVNWSPYGADHPLGADGQRLRVQLGIGVAGGAVDWFQRGWFLIQDAKPSGDVVTVNAVGLLALIEEARFVSPFQPSGTLVSTLRALLEPAVTVVVDASLSDRAVPSGITWDDDRLACVEQLLDAWPADAYVTSDGYLLALAAAVPSAPLVDLSSLDGGTAYRPEGGASREGAFNSVVARGTTSAGVEIQSVAYDYTTARKVSGSFNPLPVPYYFASPLLTTLAQCQAAAPTVLARLQRAGGRRYSVDLVPDPRLQLGDPVGLTDDVNDGLLTVVEAYQLPYTADGTHNLTVREIL